MTQPQDITAPKRFRFLFMNKNRPVVGPIHKNLVLRFLVNPQYRIWRHLSILLPFLFILSRIPTQEHRGAVDVYIRIGFITVSVLVFYFNMYKLVPRYLFREQYLTYFLLSFLIIVSLFVLAILLDWLTNGYCVSPKLTVNSGPRSFIGFVLLYGVFFAASTAVKLFQRWVVDSNRISELEKQTLRTELNQLKSQINPHFLFNTLNNVLVLNQSNPAKASLVLSKLSDLLRYQIYDTSRENILLASDIHFMDNFLHLEKIRKDDFQFQLTVTGDLLGVTVAPFLFIPFVENAVKHSADPLAPSYARIAFTIREQEVLFTCENSKPKILTANETTQGGLGLLNVQRRLYLLYGDAYQLDIHETELDYFVALKIPL